MKRNNESKVFWALAIFVILFVATFWASVAFVAVHFLLKVW